MGKSVVSFFAVLALFHSAAAQFQLVFGTQGPATAAPVVNTICADKLDNCALFAPANCGGQYEAWARDNCGLTCHYCTYNGPATTEPPCVDALDNCASFEDASCTNADYHAWALSNCRRHCRLCTASQLAQLTTTTIAPQNCVDRVDCRLYGQTVCDTSGTYFKWAQDNCMNFCGFCRGVPTTPKPCIDHAPNCNMYEKDMCQNSDYAVWVEDNCRAYCGRCAGATTGPIIMTPPPLGTHAGPALLTPPPPGRK